MPPHCDSMDGPVVRAAREALDREDVELILPYVPKLGEDDVRHAFALVLKARNQGPEAREVADRFFFETAVRVHRAGEGAPFTGLKPAGLDVGPVIPLAEAAIDTENPGPLTEYLTSAVQNEVTTRFAALIEARGHAPEGLGAARMYVSASLGLQVWAHKLYGAIHAGAHEDGGHEHQG